MSSASRRLRRSGSSRPGWAPRRGTSLALALAVLTGGLPASGSGAALAQPRPRPGAAEPAVADLERGWRQLDQQLRLLDRLLPSDPLPTPAQSEAATPLPATLLAPNAPPQGSLTPADARPVAPLALPAAADLRAGGIRALSLEEAVALALRNSATLQAQREQVAAALAELQAGFGTYWPRLVAVAGTGYDRNWTRTLAIESSQAFGIGPLYAPGGPFYSPGGGSVSSQSGTASLGAGLQLQQDLLDFARTPRIRAARARLEQQRADYANALRSLQLQVSESYYRLQQADQLVRIIDAVVRDDLVILAEALDLRQAGLVPRLDVLRRRAIEANGQEALIQALADRAVARRQLATLLNLPPAITPSAGDPIRLQPRWPLDLEQSLLAAYRGNPELEAVLATRQALAEDRQAAAAALLPKLSLFAAASTSGSRNSLWDIQLGGGGCCNASLLPEGQNSGWDWSIGLTVSWLLFDAGTSAGRTRAVALRERAAAQAYAARRNDIRLRLEQAFFQHEASLAKLASARRGVSAALEAFRDIRLRYRLGLSNEVDLSLTQEQLIRSLVQRLNATIGVNVTYAQLLRELLPVPRDPERPVEATLQLGLDDHQRSIR